MFTIGPYEFTRMDAVRTVENLDDIWGLLERDRDASVLAGLRPAVPAVLDDDNLGAVLTDVWDALLAAGPALRAAGALPTTATGNVAHLHMGGGGVPKNPIATAEVGWRGVHGDVQRVRRHHGRPWQALCIWSTEAIDALVAQGHFVVPGAAGENVTVTGLPWAEVRAGVRLRLGTVLCEVSAYALPCSTNARWFVGRAFGAMHHDRGPVSRVYATVLEPGTITLGDPAILEPS